ncbi:MAG: pentapeptide repeat-containing protein [Cyanobacteria bacterium P01_A01_bin.114]
MEKTESLKLNPINAVRPQPKANYGTKKLVILEKDEANLVGSSLNQNYVLGGHIDQDPLNTSFAPDSEHAEVLMSGAQVNASTFIGHYPGLHAEALDAAHPTVINESRFVLSKGSGYKLQVVSPIKTPLTAYQPDLVGQGSNLVKANFGRADLRGTDFTGCDLTEANFAEANLCDCNFTCAALTKASLKGADLSGATFAGANLSKADFTASVTSDATDFSYTYLVGARFYVVGAEKIAYAGCFRGAIFTDGQKRLEVANADFSRISGLIDGQFSCYYKCEVVLPPEVRCVATNRFVEARESATEMQAKASDSSSGGGFSGSDL